MDKEKQKQLALAIVCFFVIVVIALLVYLNRSFILTTVFRINDEKNTSVNGTDDATAPEKRGPQGNVQLANTLLTVPMTGAARVKSFALTGAADNPQTDFYAYAQSLTGGAAIVTGDVDGDGTDDIVVAPGAGSGSSIKVFSKNGAQKSIQITPFHANFKGPISVAVGDVDGDGKDEIGTCQAAKGEQSFCKVYKYTTEKSLLAYWKAFGNVAVGANIAFGDVDGDGRAEAITGAAVGGGPQIRVYDVGNKIITGVDQGVNLKPIQFFAFDQRNRSGIAVASGDVDGDGKYEIAAAQQAGDEAFIKLYRYNTSQTVLADFRAYPAGQTSGASIAMADTTTDGKAEIITGAGPTAAPIVRIFNAQGVQINTDFYAYEKSFIGGIHVSAGKF